MTLYRIMDLVKNGIAISYLFFLVLSFVPAGTPVEFLVV